MAPKQAALLAIVLALWGNGPALGQALWSPAFDDNATLAFTVLPDPASQSGRQFAPGQSYASAGVSPAQTAWLGTVRLWQSIYAGHASLAGNAKQGTQSVAAGVVGTTLGADTLLDDDTLLGGSAGISHQTFSAGSGNGDSDDVMLTLYGRRNFLGSAYVWGTFGYGWHAVGTERTVTLLDTDVLEARYQARDFGGRLEAGYGFAFDGIGTVSPYSAFAGDSYHWPAYREFATSGSAFYAVSYDRNTISITHTELGLRYGDTLQWDDDHTLWIDALAGWEHELDDNPYVHAAFETAPDSIFTLYGTRPARETALLGLGSRLQFDQSVTFGLRTDARMGMGTTIFSGTADITLRW